MLGVIIAYFLIWSFDTFAAPNLTFSVSFSPNFALINVIIAVFASILAAVFPARSSSKLEVIDIIREN